MGCDFLNSNYLILPYNAYRHRIFGLHQIFFQGNKRYMKIFAGPFLTAFRHYPIIRYFFSC